MEWLLIFGLLGWTVWQAGRVDTLKRELATVTQRLDRLERGRLEQGPEKSASARPNYFAPAAQPRPPAPLAPPVEDEPLLLDTPVPAACNDDDEQAPAAAPALAPGAAPAPRNRESQTPNPSAPKPLERWLAENGLAWLAGGALALGVIFLVALAARQGWLTPQVRLGLALLLGAGLIGASERFRRVSAAHPPGHPLAAAMCAGAGMAAFYAVSWAAYGLYGYIGWPVAALLLALCALALLGLAFLHGQALGVLAIAAAFLAPPLTNLAVWPSSALTLYVCAVGVAAFSLAYARAWAWSATAAFVGLYFWFAASIAADQVWRALMLLCFASVGGVTMTARATNPREPDDWRLAQALAPSMGLCVSSVFLLWTWLAIAAAPDSRIFGPALISVFHCALAAYAVRGRAAHGGVFFVAAGALAVGFCMYAAAHLRLSPLAHAPYAWTLFAAAATAAAAFGAKPHRGERLLVAIAGAGAAALLTALAAFTRSDWHSFAAWGPLFVGAGALFVCAQRAAREAPDATKDSATDAWAGAGAVLLLLAIESAFREPLSLAACAGATLALAALYAQRGWRALRIAAPSAAALALAHAFSNDVWTRALADPGELGRVLLLLGVCAGLLLGGARLATQRDPREAAAEALSSAGALAIIAGAFLVLSAFASGEPGAPLDAMTASALRALTLLAAGHVLAPSKQRPHGPIAAWRWRLLLAGGLAWALANHGLELNPWWGRTPSSIAGPPLFNVQALAFAAPAGLAILAARRARAPIFARLFAFAGAALALLWVTLEIRHAFHGEAMSQPGLAGLEGFAYALWPLALLAAAQGRLKAANNSDLSAVAAWAAWPILCWAAWGLWGAFNPWWGAGPGELAPELARLAALAAFAGGAWLSARAPTFKAHAPHAFAQAGKLACLGHLLAGATLAVRMAYHGADLAFAPAASAELWTYSALWALFGAGAFWLGARRKDALLRWSGLVLLMATSAYVAFLAFTRLDDMARVGSLLGLAAVLLAVTWFARTGAGAKRGAV